MAANKPIIRGPSGENLDQVKRARKDVTPLHQMVVGGLTYPQSAAVMILVMGLGSVFVFPAAFVPLLIFNLLLFLMTKYRKANSEAVLPLRIPQVDEPSRIDFNDPKPGHNGNNKSRGLFFIGNAWDGNKEVWAANSDVLTHSMVLGGTGAGKTETLVSMAYNMLALGSGYAYVDPKAAAKLAGQNWIMARSLGRDDDLRFLNFAIGQEEWSASPYWRSNTLQPFAFGKAEGLKEIPLSLMAGGGDKGGGGNEIFSSNAKSLMTALTYGLVDRRNSGKIYFSVSDLREYLNPEKFVELALSSDIQPRSAIAMKSFLTSMGWKDDGTGDSKYDPDNWGDFARQYSYAQNYFMEPLSTMADTYSHIFNVPIGDIHMVDVILQRRIFVTLLPSLEKSKKEAASLGRITLAQLRLATAVGLGGGEIMGSWNAIVETTPTSARVPFCIYADEYAAIAVDGFAEIFTQGRGLYISATIGSQDYAGIKKANEAEAQQIVANAKLKYIMTGDDPNDTKKLIQDLAGEIEEFRSTGLEIGNFMDYKDNKGVSLQKVSRVNMLDIAAQVEGEWHLFWKDRIIRGKVFHAGAEAPKNQKGETPIFVHHFLMVRRPDKKKISSLYGSIAELVDRWTREDGDGFTTIDEAIEYTKGTRHKDLSGLLEVINSMEHEEHAELYQKVSDKNNSIRREITCAAIQVWAQKERFNIADFISPEKIVRSSGSGSGIGSGVDSRGAKGGVVNQESPNIGAAIGTALDAAVEASKAQKRTSNAVADKLAADFERKQTDAESKEKSPAQPIAGASGAISQPVAGPISSQISSQPVEPIDLDKYNVVEEEEEFVSDEPSAPEEVRHSSAANPMSNQPILKDGNSSDRANNAKIEAVKVDKVTNKPENSIRDDLDDVDFNLIDSITDQIIDQEQSVAIIKVETDIGGKTEREAIESVTAVARVIKEGFKDPAYPQPPEPEPKDEKELTPILNDWITKLSKK